MPDPIQFPFATDDNERDILFFLLEKEFIYDNERKFVSLENVFNRNVFTFQPDQRNHYKLWNLASEEIIGEVFITFDNPTEQSEPIFIKGKRYFFTKFFF